MVFKEYGIYKSIYWNPFSSNLVTAITLKFISIIINVCNSDKSGTKFRYAVLCLLNFFEEVCAGA